MADPIDDIFGMLEQAANKPVLDLSQGEPNNPRMTPVESIFDRLEQNELQQSTGIASDPQNPNPRARRGIPQPESAPFSVRARVAASPIEKRKELSERLGVFADPSTGRQMFMKADGTAVPLDAPGFEVGDLGDALPSIVSGGVGAAGAVGGFFLGGPLLGGVMGATAAQLGLSLTEFASLALENDIDFTPGTEDFATITRIVNDFGPGVATNFILEMLGYGAFRAADRLATATVQSVRSPNLTRMEEPATQAVMRASRDLGIRQTIDTAGGTAARLLAVAEQKPGGSTVVRKRKNVLQTEIENRTAGITGADLDKVEVLSEAARDLDLLRARQIDRLDAKLKGERDRISTEVSTPTQSGNNLRAKIIRDEKIFHKEQAKLEASADTAIAIGDPKKFKFVRLGPAKKRVQELLNELVTRTNTRTVDTGVFDPVSGRNFTRTVEETEIVKSLASEIQKKLEGILSLDNVTDYRNARAAIQSIDFAIKRATKLPGMDVGRLMETRNTLLEAVETSLAKNPPSELAAGAINRALSHYKNNIGKFQHADVQSVLSPDTEFVRASAKDVLTGPFRAGEVDTVMAIVKAAGGRRTAEVKAALRSTYDDIVTDSMFPLGHQFSGKVSPKALFQEIQKLPGELQDLMFGASKQSVKRLLNSMSKRHGLIDATEMLRNPGDQSVIKILRSAAKAEQKALREFNAGPGGRFLAGAKDGVEPTAEEIVRFRLARVSKGSAQKLMRKLSPERRDEVRRLTIQDLFQRSRSTGSKSEDSILALERGRATPGTKLSSKLETEAVQNVRESLEALSGVLSPTQMKLVRDVAILHANRGRVDAAAQSVGGITAGMLVARLLTLSVSALKPVMGANVTARLLVSEPIEKWLLSQRRFGPRSETAKAFQLASPFIFSAIKDAMRDDGVDVNNPTPEWKQVIDFWTMKAPIAAGLKFIEDASDAINVPGIVEEPVPSGS